MAHQLANFRMDYGGICYAACQESFVWWNASMHWCRKGCDFAKGRVNDPLLRKEAVNMCKMMAVSEYQIQPWEDLDSIADMRIHSTMYPENATNLFKACVSGIRRQKF
jgi:hypothetical protein